MKKQLQTGLILSMIFLYANSFGQTTELRSSKVKNDTLGEKTYLSLLVNMVNTNLNYGKSSSALTDNKKSLRGVQIGASFQAGIRPGVKLIMI